MNGITKSKSTKLLSALLAVLMIVAMLPTTAFAWSVEEGTKCTSTYGDHYVGSDGEMFYSKPTTTAIFYNDDGKIAENPNEDANEGELPGIGGAINFICKDLNDIYAGKEPTDEWRKIVAEKVKDSFEDYVAILRYLWNVVESNPLYKAIITKEMLCVGRDGKVVKEVMNALNGND